MVTLDTSYLARLGMFLEPVSRWLGFDWRLTMALITSFPAKENAIATLGVLFGSSPEGGLAQTLAASFSAATALSFLVVTVLFIPCMATVAVTRQETGSWGWALLSVGFAALIIGCCRGRHISSGCQSGVVTMLEQLVFEIRSGGTFTTESLAHRLGTTTEMVLVLLEHLREAGRLSPYQPCADACKGCGLQGACGPSHHLNGVRLWQG